jgi:hypothetical protein
MPSFIMRILHIDSGTEMRGGQRQVLRLIEGLRERGHANVLLAPMDAPLSAQARQRQIEVRKLSWLSVRACSRNADVTHAHDARSHSAAALAGPDRFVVSRRVAFGVQRNPVSRWKYARAAHYIAVSEYVRRTLLSAGVEASRISVVYDGVPMQPLSQGSAIVVPESRDPSKGMAIALDGVKLAGLDATISTDLEQDLATAGLFVYITHSEGLGSAVLLAMAAGVPVIASHVGGLPEIVEHERTGLLTENSAGAIAVAIRRLLQNPDFAQSLAAQARCHVRARFSVDRLVSDTVAVYEKLA